MKTTSLSQLSHAERIKSELKQIGISRLGLHRLTSHYVSRFIHEDEHIMAAIFGRRKEVEGLFGFMEGMLIATDKRVLFINHRPGYTTMDEVGYDMVSGINLSNAWPYASVTLFTKIANYTLSFVAPKSAELFVDYIEKRRIDNNTSVQVSPIIPADNRAALEFLATHELGVLSSIERTGSVTGAVVYYILRDGLVYFMTKTATRKASNILGNQHVAFTVFDAAKLQTVQMQGVVEAEPDEQTKMEVSDLIVKPRHYDSGSHLPPVMRLGGDEFVIFRIVPTRFNFLDYSKR